MVPHGTIKSNCFIKVFSAKGFEKMQGANMEQLGDYERKTLKFQIETLERRDVLNSNK